MALVDLDWIWRSTNAAQHNGASNYLTLRNTRDTRRRCGGGHGSYLLSLLHWDASVTVLKFEPEFLLDAAREVLVIP
jgi:hypothetical protein